MSRILFMFYILTQDFQIFKEKHAAILQLFGTWNLNFIITAYLALIHYINTTTKKKEIQWRPAIWKQKNPQILEAWGECYFQQMLRESFRGWIKQCLIQGILHCLASSIFLWPLTIANTNIDTELQNSQGKACSHIVTCDNLMWQHTDVI